MSYMVKNTSVVLTSFAVLDNQVAIAPPGQHQLIKDAMLLQDLTLVSSTLALITYLRHDFKTIICPIRILPSSSLVLHPTFEILYDDTTVISQHSITTFVTSLGLNHIIVVDYMYTRPNVPFDWNADRVARARVGTVALTTGSITFESPSSPSRVFGTTTVNERQSVHFCDPVALSLTLFLLPWYDESFETSDATTSSSPSTLSQTGSVPDQSGLCVTLFDRLSPTKKHTTCTRQYQPAYHMAATHLVLEHEKEGVYTTLMAFYDRLNHFALTLVVVTVEASSSLSLDTSFTVHFRHQVVVSRAGEFEFGRGFAFFPTPSLAILSSERIVVSYLAPELSGAPVFATFSFEPLTQRLSLTTSPTPLLSPHTSASFSIANIETDAMSSALLVLSPTSLVIGYLEHRAMSAPTPKQPQEHAQPPLFGMGVLTLGTETTAHRHHSVKGLVTEKGHVAVLSPGRLVPTTRTLVIGKHYYATPKGQLMDGPMGTTSTTMTSTTSSVTPVVPFVFLTESLMVSAQSYIGVAVDVNLLAV